MLLIVGHIGNIKILEDFGGGGSQIVRVLLKDVCERLA